MRLLVACIRPSRKHAVQQALRNAGVAGWSESPVHGYGKAAGGRGVEHLRLDIVMQESRVQEVAAVIASTARTGDPGDGMVLALPVAFAIRIDTGEPLA